MKVLILLHCLTLSWATLTQKYTIRQAWNGELLEEKDYVEFSIGTNADNDGVEIEIKAPFYDDPPPPNATEGEAYYGLWDYEVAEVFFLSQDFISEPQYLELEFGPHGQHLGLILNGVRNAIDHSFPLKYEAQIQGQFWTGKAIIPKKYFPPNVNRLNAYAINGIDKNRTYKALYPVYGDAPDFHRLDFFLPYDGHFINGLISDFWSQALN